MDYAHGRGYKTPAETLAQEGVGEMNQLFREIGEAPNYVLQTWQGVSFWCVPDKDHPSEYTRLEAYCPNIGLTYRLNLDNPFDRTHPSGWYLAVIQFGYRWPCAVLSNHPALETDNFEELFAAMALFAQVDDDSWTLFDGWVRGILGARLEPYLERLPEWIKPTIEATRRRERDRH